MQEAQRRVGEACRSLGLDREPTVISTNGFRIMVEEVLNGSELLWLEAKLQRLTGRPIDIRIEPLADKNKRKERSGGL